MTLARPFRLLYVQVLLGMGLGMTVGHSGHRPAHRLNRSAMRSSRWYA
ncbi:hypothetical protein AWB67_06175 [Caballeronia terrestris]|uniref:Uncharacterized protein n=1 Tax=Caballeronia terrestris TaxID=1226301 RepID=A0A158KPW2_9BURK|nr:hypothetical protein AWB67_06175 [Caballeronia terrestris]